MVLKKNNKAASASDYPYEYILAISTSNEAARNHAGAVNFHSAIEKYQWAGDKCVPPCTPLYDVIEAFRRNTDLPLDLAMHSMFFYLSTWLLDCGTSIKCDGQTLTPEIWTIVLAPSGCGKTYSLDRIKKSAPVQASIMGIKSGAAFFDALQENSDLGRVNAMVVDEVGQMIQQIEQIGSPLATLKESLLNAYGGGEISHTTARHGRRTVANTTMTFLGLNVDQTLLSVLSPTSMLDGFAQRFTFVFSKRDPSRHFKDFPRYNNAQIEEVTECAWKKLTEATPLECYTYTLEALKAYDDSFREFGEHIERDGVVNVSFFRRTMQRAHRLALLYHVILGKAENPTIDVEDVQWAMRMTACHLIDAATIIVAKSGKAGDIMNSIDSVAKRFAAKGEALTCKSVGQYVRAVKDGHIPSRVLLDAYNKGRE